MLLVVPFEPEHLTEAAGLLARRHANDLKRNPQLPAQYADSSVTLKLLAPMVDKRQLMGAAAFQDGKLAGFLLGEPITNLPDSSIAPYYRLKSILVRYHAHGVVDGPGGEIYRELYAEAAAQWVAAGFFAHYIQLQDGNHETHDAFTALGFGRDLGWTIRDLDSLTREWSSRRQQIRIRQATAEDVDDILELYDVLERFESRSPVFLPPQTITAQLEVGAELADSLGNPGVRHWLAEDDGAVIGLMTFTDPPTHISPMLTPDRTTNVSAVSVHPEIRGKGIGSALLAHGASVARTAGYNWCRLSWMTANPTSTQFWRHRGFTPLAWRLTRIVDSRVSRTS